jgi:NUBPL iron-transfer P-loop NTPase
MIKIKSKYAFLVVLSNKGGVGKTTVGLTVAEQLAASNNPFIIIDTDAFDPSVGLTYDKETYELIRSSQKIVSDSTFKKVTDMNMDELRLAIWETIKNGEYYFALDMIFESIERQNILLILPSEHFSVLQKWMEDCKIAQAIEHPENELNIVFFFVTDGTPISLKLFDESVKYFDGKIQHVLVKNLGAKTNINWEHSFDVDGRTQNTLSQYGFQSISFPELIIDLEYKNKIFSEYIPFQEAIKSNWISKGSQIRLNKWLAEVTKSMGSTGFVPYHPSYK